MKDGFVYDAFTGHQGLTIAAFKALWQYAEDIDFGFFGGDAMSLPPVLEDVRRRSGMVLISPTLDNIVPFLIGYDTALSGGLLSGFRECLVMRLGYGSNLVWEALARNILKQQYSHDDTNGQIEGLFVLIEQFLQERRTHDGLRAIYKAYEQWYEAWLAAETK